MLQKSSKQDGTVNILWEITMEETPERLVDKKMQKHNSSENSGEGDGTTNDTADQQPPMKPCLVYDGSELIAIYPPFESDNKKEHKG